MAAAKISSQCNKACDQFSNLAQIPAQNDVDVAEIGIGVRGCTKRHIEMEVAFGQQDVGDHGHLKLRQLLFPHFYKKN